MLTMFIINSCSKNDDGISYDLTGDWKVVSFREYRPSIKITKSEDNTWLDVNNGDITVNFTAPDDCGKGVISGINVTNVFFGNYMITKNGEITIGPITTTFIGEPEWAQLFHSIGAAENYDIRNSNLIIYYNNRKSSITLTRN